MEFFSKPAFWSINVLFVSVVKLTAALLPFSPLVFSSLPFDALFTARLRSLVTLTQFFFGKIVSIQLLLDSPLIGLSNFNSFALCFLLCLSRPDTFTNLTQSKIICLSQLLLFGVATFPKTFCYMFTVLNYMSPCYLNIFRKKLLLRSYRT